MTPQVETLLREARDWLATRDHPMNMHGQQSLTDGNKLETMLIKVVLEFDDEIEFQKTRYDNLREEI